MGTLSGIVDMLYYISQVFWRQYEGGGKVEMDRC